MNKDDLLLEMRKRFELSRDWWREVYQQSSDDLLFLYDEQNQWDTYIRNKRNWAGKPVIAQNELLIAHKSIVNRQQTNKIGVVVQAGNDEASEQTGEFLQDATRAIEQESKAYVSYEWGFKQAVGGGIGWGRVLTDYESIKTFDQKAVVKRVLNPFSILPDYTSSEHDFSDAEYFFVNARISRKEHEELIKKYNSIAEITSFEFVNDRKYIDDEHCVMLEYWYKEYTTKTLIKVNYQGTVKEFYKEDYDKSLYEQLKAGGFIEQEDKREVPTIKWIKTDGYNIFEQTDWLGDYFPFFAIIGEEIYIEGKRWFQGIVRNSKDAQMMLNHAVSSTAEIMSLATKSQWLGVEGSFTNTKWNSQNTTNYAYLEHAIVYDKNGNPMPAPQKIQFEPPVGRLNEQQAIASNFIKSTSGVYNASVGAPSDEKSGRAIQQRNAQTEITNYNYANNLESAVEYCGKILVNLLMKLWTEPAKKRIVKADGTQKIVPINQQYEEQGETRQIDLTKGEYSVTVTAGASYANKKQEQAALTLGLMQVNPLVANNPLVAYHYAKDIGATEVADAIYKTIPEQLKDDNQQQQIPPQLQQQMQENQQLIEQLTQALNKAQDELQSKESETNAKVQMNSENNIVKLIQEEMKQNNASATELFKAEIAQLQQKLDRLHAMEMLDKQNQVQQEQMRNAGQNIPQEAEA